MTVTIYHNPKCSKSRATLALIREQGIEPKIIAYLDEPLDQTLLTKIIKESGLSPREALRNDADPMVFLPTLMDEQVIELLVQYPTSLNRPFVITDKGVRLCRPPERVFEIL